VGGYPIRTHGDKPHNFVFSFLCDAVFLKYIAGIGYVFYLLFAALQQLLMHRGPGNGGMWVGPRYLIDYLNVTDCTEFN
jgi:hypothetical protein